MTAARPCDCGRESPDDEDGAARFCRYCGGLAAPAPAPDAWIGRTIAGRFTIVRSIADGNCGRIYLAEQALGRTKRPVAVKMLLPEHAADVEMVQRFLRECETVSLIEHPNVVRIHDFGEAEAGVLYIAMELVPGCSLARVLAEEGALEPARAWAALAQMCRAVAAVHDRGIVHRDLKPDNVMLVRAVDEPELVKLIDFGIAKTLAPPSGAALTRMGAVIGSPAYMSPEQLLGGSIDTRTDIYALGVVAYEMFTGTLPFVAEDLHGWAAQHVTAAPRPFDTSPAGGRVSAPLRRAILRALSKNPDERQPTVRAFLRELSMRPETLAPAATAPPPLPVQAQGGAPRAAAHPLLAAAPPRVRALAKLPWWALTGLLACTAASLVAVVTETSGSDDAAARASTAPSASAASASAMSASEGVATVSTSTPPLSALPPSAQLVLSPLAPSAAVAVLPASTQATPLPQPRALAKATPNACDAALWAATCDAARAAQRRCTDGAALHDRVRDRVLRLCAAQDHKDALELRAKMESAMPAGVSSVEPASAGAGVPGRPGLAGY